MKLKNRKTGEITEIEEVHLIVMSDECDCYESFADYHSLAELNADWEDYAPKEPLIKDEKIRKAVRAWAEACSLTHVTYKLASNEFYDADTRGKFAIKFTLIPIEVYLKDGESYTIAELCGEEEV